MAVRLEGVPLPTEEIAARKAAMAFIELGRHDRALEVFRAAQRKLEATGKEGSTAHFEVRLAQVRCLVELRRFAEAGKLLDQLDALAPTYLMYRGQRTPNWQKGDVAIERGWWLIAQDRLGEAERYFAELVHAAPQSSAARVGLAHCHTLRGWPRLAREELEEATQLSPEDVGAWGSLGLALFASGEPEGAERIADSLSTVAPTEPAVRELARTLQVGRMFELSSEASASSGNAGVDGLVAELGLRSPPLWKRITLGVELGTKIEGTSGSVQRRRMRVDAQATVFPGLSMTARGAMEPFAKRWGAAAAVSFQPDDHWSFGLQGDSNTWSLPPGATLYGRTGMDVDASADYRHTESFSVGARGRLLRMSDTNRIWESSARAELQLFATGYLRAVVGLDLGTQGATFLQDLYYAPKFSWSALLAPSLEHLWLRTRRYSLSHRLTLAGGIESERIPGIPITDRWRAEYQQIHRFGDTGEIILDAGLARRHYGGTPDVGAQLSLSGKLRF